MLTKRKNLKTPYVVKPDNGWKISLSLIIILSADTATAVEKAATLKHKFIERWSTKGRTEDALYSEWQNLKFDPTSDDIDEFISDVKNLAKYLGYPKKRPSYGY